MIIMRIFFDYLINYNFIYKNRKIQSKDGVAMYIQDNIQFNLCEDLSISNLNLYLLNPLVTVILQS